MEPVSQTPPALDFGRFRVLLHRRELLADDRPLDLGGRAYDVLVALIEARGAVVSKDALIQRVWPGRVVEENNLQAQIWALRKAFAADRDLIRTVAGRGYQFTGEVRAAPASPGATAGIAQPPAASFPPPTNLPEQVSELIGRDAELNEVLDLGASHRLVTLAGAGGIGKTRLAIEAARHLLPRFADGVWVAELAPLSDPGLVAVTVATALGIELPGGVLSAERVAKALGLKQVLLVLDNCEHVIDAAAQMTEALLSANPAARVIATSREPLRAEGEWVYPVPPLAVPTEVGSNIGDTLRYGAVRLFVERARAAAPYLSPDGRAVAAMVAICRRLDGIPLAIELAAARAAALGIEGLLARLDDRFRLLAGGRRTALPRHQTLRATMDWSHDLLPDREKVIFRRLAVFQGDFTMEAAQAVAVGGDIAAAQVFEAVATLAAKSLVTTDISGEVTYYRLLDTTRAYSDGKLVEAGEFEAIRRLHAEYYRDLFRKAEPEVGTRAAGDRSEEYNRQVGNLRAALNWAFSDTGDARVGVALASVATDFWLTASLLSECCDWGAKALAHLGPAEGTRDEMKLQCGLGLALTYVRGMTQEARSALTRALTLSEELGDVSRQFRALYGLWLFALRVVDFRKCLSLANQYELLAKTVGDSAASAVADWMLGMSRYYLGEHASAAANLQRAHAAYPSATRTGVIRFGVHTKVSILSYQAVTFWSLGSADSAIQASRDAIQHAHDVNHPVSLCIALQLGSLLLVKIGDLDRAESCIDQLIDHAGKHSLIPYYAAGLCTRGSLMATRGDLLAAEQWLRSGLERTREVAYYLFYAFFLGEWADVLARSGRVEEGLAEIDVALRYANESESLWCMPELLRIKGKILATHARPDFAAAHDHFSQALDLAHGQDALFWELRAATSLARLLRDQGRHAHAAGLLRPVYDRFTGFATADLKAAKALLEEMS